MSGLFTVLFGLVLIKTVLSLQCFDHTCHPPATVCKLSFGHGTVLGGHCDHMHLHGNHPKCGTTFPSHGHCHCDDDACMIRAHLLTTTSTAGSPTTAGPVVTTAGSGPVVTGDAMTSVTPQPTTQKLLVCTDNDARCSDPIYMGLLCKATDDSTHQYAVQTCPVACNFCSEYLAFLQATKASTIPPTSTVAAVTSKPVCEDKEAKCSDSIYTGILCGQTDAGSIAYAASTCPKTCDRCTEYFASLNA